ncbi:MAG: DUF1780 domain-containing protein [Dissulfurispiraceae bacterium]
MAKRKSESKKLSGRFLEDRRHDLKESVEYFSSKNKRERERWVCIEFLKNIGITFDERDVVSPDDDPPDVVFRDARFEIKDVLDPGRRRHAEYKVELQKALETSDPQDLLRQFTPKDITPLQVGERILSELKRLNDHYAPSVRANLDLLFYVNLIEHSLKVGPMPTMATFSPFGWRSISALSGSGWVSLVFFAPAGAPSFLHSGVGTLIQRRFALSINVMGDN